jgi:squalene cyclase
MTRAKAVTGDERAMLVAGLFWSGAAKGQVEKAVQDLLDHQRPDGGWGGNAYLPSDAYTTAVSLVALNESGAASAAASDWRRGVDYLLKSQFPDGSWYVASRAVKFQPYFQSGFPFEHDQWISAAATAMAVSALAPAAANQ